jgi:hypothetical protein
VYLVRALGGFPQKAETFLKEADALLADAKRLENGEEALTRADAGRFSE